MHALRCAATDNAAQDRIGVGGRYWLAVREQRLAGNCLDARRAITLVRSVDDYWALSRCIGEDLIEVDLGHRRRRSCKGFEIRPRHAQADANADGHCD
jgi:hypothetical protein